MFIILAIFIRLVIAMDALTLRECQYTRCNSPPGLAATSRCGPVSVSRTRILKDGENNNAAIMPRHCRKCLLYQCSKNEESMNFPARSIRIFEKIFTRGGEIVILVETCMNTEGIPVCSVSISKELYWSFNSNSLHIIQSSMYFDYLH